MCVDDGTDFRSGWLVGVGWLDCGVETGRGRDDVTGLKRIRQTNGATEGGKKQREQGKQVVLYPDQSTRCEDLASERPQLRY